MPEGVQKEDEQKDEETLGCNPSRRSVRFEKAEVKSLEKELEIEFHQKVPVKEVDSVQYHHNSLYPLLAGFVTPVAGLTTFVHVIPNSPLSLG
jgi:hypothetical protein